MSRLVAAAEQLVAEVEELRKSVKTKLGEMDGLGFIRDVEFDAATAKWLEPILEAVDDPRIESFVDKTVTFVSDVRADFATYFNLDQADQVLAQE